MVARHALPVHHGTLDQDGRGLPLRAGGVGWVWAAKVAGVALSSCARSVAGSAAPKLEVEVARLASPLTGSGLWRFLASAVHVEAGGQKEFTGGGYGPSPVIDER